MRNNRENNQIRPLTVERNYTKYALGSVLISYGNTKVLCTASCEEKVPKFMKGSNRGWVTAEYSMLPSATHTRSNREVTRGKQSGRTNEIQRLIGRSLRAVIDCDKLGERTITIDCDVLQADGGTRTAAITGGMIALSDAVDTLLSKNLITETPIKEWVAAISVGKYRGEIIADLCYEEDSNADLDMNIVLTESNKIVEIQGTAEKETFSRQELMVLLEVAENAISQIFQTIKAGVQAAN